MDFTTNKFVNDAIQEIKQLNRSEFDTFVADLMLAWKNEEHRWNQLRVGMVYLEAFGTWDDQAINEITKIDVHSRTVTIKDHSLPEDHSAKMFEVKSFRIPYRIWLSKEHLENQDEFKFTEL